MGGLPSAAPRFWQSLPAGGFEPAAKAQLRSALGDEEGNNGLRSRGNASRETARLPWPRGVLPKPAPGSL